MFLVWTTTISANTINKDTLATGSEAIRQPKVTITAPRSVISTRTHTNKNSTKMEKIYGVILQKGNGEMLDIHLCNTDDEFMSMTVLQLKEKIAEILPRFKAEKAYRLSFRTEVLYDDSALLSAYGIKQMSIIHMIILLPGGGSDPERGDGGMGDKGGKNRSMEKLSFF